MTVAVVGAGAVGLSCAWYLRAAGADVVVLDSGRAGSGASSGNAGWVTPGLSNPIPAPGVTAQALRWMTRPDSPFYIRPRADPALAGWLWRFWRSTSRERYLAGMRAMLALNARTLELFDGLLADGVEMEHHADGMLFAFLTERAAREEAAVLDELRREGYRGAVELLTGDEARALEPTLGDRVKAAVHVPAERHVRPETMTAGLVAALAQRDVEVREEVRVTRIEPNRGGWSVATDTGELAASRVVVACGAWTGPLLRPLGVRIRQEAAKGYSITAKDMGARPARPLYLGETKVAVSPFADGVRLAGTLELAGLDLSPNRRRLDAVSRAAGEYLRDWRPGTAAVEWTGLRPLPPDGLPLIGAAPGHEGLYVATGHGMLGITLAPATGAALAPLVLEGRSVPELAPFRPGR